MTVVNFEAQKRIKGGEEHYEAPNGEVWFYYTIDFIHKGRKFAVPFSARNDQEAEEIFDTIKNEATLGQRIVNLLENS